MFRLCIAIGYLHPDYIASQLTARQLLEWEEYYDCEPWGEARADMREEASQLRLLARMFGGDMPQASFPYFADNGNAEEMSAAAGNTESNLEPDGKGGYRWRQPLQS